VGVCQKVALVFADRYVSELGNRICEEYDIDFVALFNLPVNVGLRTAKDDVNVADIAKFLGGGGHPKAAGFPVSGCKKTVRYMLEQVIEQA